MRLNLFFFSSLAGLAASQDTFSTDENCWTAMTRDPPASVDTFTFIETETDTIYSTTRIQRTTTETPDPTTTTITKTTIATVKKTANVKSDTMQVVDTKYTTLTITTTPSTSVTTATATTVTTIGYTTTVLPPESFTPILDTLPGATLRSSSGVPAQKRDVDNVSPIEKKRSYLGGSLAARAAIRDERDANLSPRDRRRYPYEVDCYVTTYIPETVVVTKTMRSVYTTTAPTPVSTITKLKTISTTDTIFPPDVTVYTTSTSTSAIKQTIVPTTTSTTTTTITNTVSVATATAYPMCGGNNYADSKTVGGFGFNYPVFSSGFNPLQMGTDAGSPYNCCVKCINTPGCLASYVYVGTNTCSMIYNPTGSTTCSSTNVCSATIGWFQESQVNSIFMNGPALKYTGYWAPP